MGQVTSPSYPPPTSLEHLPEHVRADTGHASRGSRLWASLIDLAIASVFVIPAQYFAGFYDDFPRVKQPQLPESLLWMVGGLVLTLAIHGPFLARSAQTIGKRALGIRIVTVKDNAPAPLARIVLWRMLPLSLLAQIPYVGPLLGLIDVLAIFRQDRRCLHDHVAGTRVLQVAP